MYNPRKRKNGDVIARLVNALCTEPFEHAAGAAARSPTADRAVCALPQVNLALAPLAAANRGVGRRVSLFRGGGCGGCGYRHACGRRSRQGAAAADRAAIDTAIAEDSLVGPPAAPACTKCGVGVNIMASALCCSFRRSQNAASLAAADPSRQPHPRHRGRRHHPAAHRPPAATACTHCGVGLGSITSASLSSSRRSQRAA